MVYKSQNKRNTNLAIEHRWEIDLSSSYNRTLEVDVSTGTIGSLHIYVHSTDPVSGIVSVNKGNIPGAGSHVLLSTLSLSGSNNFVGGLSLDSLYASIELPSGLPTTGTMTISFVSKR